MTKEAPVVATRFNLGSGRFVVQADLIESANATKEYRSNGAPSNLLYLSAAVTVVSEEDIEYMLFSPEDVGNALALVGVIRDRFESHAEPFESLDGICAPGAAGEAMFRENNRAYGSSDMPSLSEEDDERLRKSLLEFGDDTFLFAYRIEDKLYLETSIYKRQRYDGKAESFEKELEPIIWFEQLEASHVHQVLSALEADLRNLAVQATRHQ